MPLKTILATCVIAATMAGCSPAPAATPRPTSVSSAPTPASTAAPMKSPQPAVGPTPAAVVKSTANWDEMSFDQVTTVGDETTAGRWIVKKGKARVETGAAGK